MPPGLWDRGHPEFARRRPVRDGFEPRGPPGRYFVRMTSHPARKVLLQVALDYVHTSRALPMKSA